MREEGMYEEEIAAACFISVHVVKQRLQLQRSLRLYLMFMPRMRLAETHFSFASLVSSLATQ